ncbi:hypothetical protein NKR23_g611 [Pleurostoma richardsiae]|uniref:NADAR domain-containing protein n=1 Tax=Pleurostoma richardsiae TaxID=41990 RepID=A0AA38SD95_9PEZI|nr:hypothetical protein NKR23_g611 [Pleurostoma richardsiae]
MSSGSSRVTKRRAPARNLRPRAKAVKSSMASEEDASTASTNHEADDNTSPLFFWRESHPETGYLSQWWPCAFRDAADPSKTYKTAEHYMMHQKALLFNDQAVAARVLAAGHPRDVKKLGRQVHGFDEAAWVAARERIVEEGTYLKFTQVIVPRAAREVGEAALRRGTAPGSMPVGEGGLRGLLLDTGDRELVEASPYDRIWGIGFREAGAEGVRGEWGLNLLGKALMRVRERLRREKEEREEKENGEEED